MVALVISETSKTLAVTGGYVTLVGLVSYFVKEKLFMSEALLATLAGIIFGPIALGWFDPSQWTTDLNYLTYEIARIIIAIQVLFTGIALPKAYLKNEWRSLATLLGPVMTTAWFICGLLIWALIPELTFLESLVIGSCVTPTDPVLANSICKGRFAEKHVPLHVRNIILAEAGANDGLGFPFLYIALYLILIKTPDHPYHSVGGAVLEWFYNIVLYQILLSCIIGTVIGYVARKVLRFAEEKNLIDHESFLAFGIALTFFTLGVVGILGSDDILCCFVVGNSFTWDDWFRVETENHAFQDVIDQLLNSGIFLYFGAIVPWAQFGNFESITPWRLVVLGILIMLIRRLPWVLALMRLIPTLPTWREAAFAGFFGPIGVGAVFYTQVALQELPESRAHLRAVLLPVNYFLILTSVIVHGVIIPVGKGFQHARSATLTLSRSQNNLSGPDKVSRLPTALPLGSAALQEQASRDLEEGRWDSFQRQNDGPAIRFNLENSNSSNATLDPGDQTQPPGGILSKASACKASLPPTPPSGRNTADHNWSRSDGDRINKRLSGGRDGDDRETAQSNQRGQAWTEGHEVVIESLDGEKLEVVSRAVYERQGKPHGEPKER